jgi:hypothetical protein
LYTAADETDDFSDEAYIKGDSFQQVADQIEKYSNGLLITKQFGLNTRNIKYGYLREVYISNFPKLTSNDFYRICEKRSFCF